MRRIQIRFPIYLDNLLIIGRNKEDVPLGRDTFIFVLQNLQFTIQRDKSCMEPKQVIKFLGFIINCKTMTIYLPEEKMKKIVSHSEKVF